MKKDDHRATPSGGTRKSPPARARVRLDLLLVENGLAESREQAQRLIMAGAVIVPNLPNPKPGSRVPEDAAVQLTQTERFVSRGGLKLDGALDALQLNPAGLACADIGAATGGFTDCLLQRGAAAVYAVDVGQSQLHQRLRSDPRVVLINHTNARDLNENTIPAPPQLIVADLSFISLEKVLAPIRRIAAPATRFLALVKPQFEAPRTAISKGRGVIRDPAVQYETLRKVATAAVATGWMPLAVTPSPISGSAGNQEWFLLMEACMTGEKPTDMEMVLAGWDKAPVGSCQVERG